MWLISTYSPVSKTLCGTIRANVHTWLNNAFARGHAASKKAVAFKEGRTTNFEARQGVSSSRPTCARPGGAAAPPSPDSCPARRCSGGSSGCRRACGRSRAPAGPGPPCWPALTCCPPIPCPGPCPAGCMRSGGPDWAAGALGGAAAGARASAGAGAMPGMTIAMTGLTCGAALAQDRVEIVGASERGHSEGSNDVCHTQVYWLEQCPGL